MRRTFLLLLSRSEVGLLLPAVTSARTLNVHVGQSINQAVNHAHPGDRIFIDPTFAVDLAWDTTRTDNCWSGNTFRTSFPPELPPCP